jgi:hypothetical protein
MLFLKAGKKERGKKNGKKKEGKNLRFFVGRKVAFFSLFFYLEKKKREKNLKKPKKT